MLTFRWRSIAPLGPPPRIVAVRRPLMEVEASFRRIGMWTEALPRVLRSLELEIDAMLRKMPALVVPYSSMAERSVCAMIYEHCLGRPMPPGWWEAMGRRNVQADPEEALSEARANAVGIRAVFPEIYGGRLACR